MALATLSIDLVAKLAQFEKDLERVARSSEQQTARIGAAFAGASRVVGALAGSAVVAGLASLVRANVEAVDAFNDLKDATGASIENISALDDIARRTGTGFDTVASTLVKFNNTLKEAKPDNAAGAVLKALNLDIQRLKDLDPAEAVREVAVALKGYSDDGDKARAVQELFGKSVREVAPLLNDLAEAGSLNAKVTSEQAAQAEKLAKAMAQMQANINDAGRSIALTLVPVLNDLADTLKKEGLAGLLGLGGARVESKILSNEITTVVRLIEKYQDAAAKGDKDAIERVNNLREQYRRLSGQLTTLNEQFKDSPDASFDRLEGRRLTRRLTVEDTAAQAAARKKAAEEAARLADSGAKLALGFTLQDSGLSTDFLDKWNQLTAAYKANRISLQQLTDAQAELLKAQPFARQEAYTGDVSDALTRRIDAQARAQARAEDLARRLDQLDAATPTARLEAQRDVLREITEAYEQGRYGAVGSAEAAQRYGEVVNAYLGNLPDKIEDASSAARDLGLAFTSAFEAAVVGGGKVSDVIKGLASDIARLYLRKTVTEPAADYFSKMFTSGDTMTVGYGILNRIGGLFGGGGASSVPAGGVFGLGGYAAGGDHTGGYRIVGEAGPEIEATGPARIFNAQQTREILQGKGNQGGAQPVVVYQNFTVGDVASMAQVQATVEGSERRLARFMARRERMAS